MMLQDGMSINIRSEEEWEVFVEIATKEGLTWDGGGSLKTGRTVIDNSVQIGVFCPRKITWCDLNYTTDKCQNLVEASDIFRNYLISRRLKK